MKQKTLARRSAWGVRRWLRVRGPSSDGETGSALPRFTAEPACRPAQTKWPERPARPPSVDRGGRRPLARLDQPSSPRAALPVSDAPS